MPAKGDPGEPRLDAGRDSDGGSVPQKADAGETTQPDAGHESGLDGGVPEKPDAGNDPVDAGPPKDRDGGLPEKPDAGNDPVDAGPPKDRDGGPPEKPDAGNDPVDAGPPKDRDGGEAGVPDGGEIDGGEAPVSSFQVLAARWNGSSEVVNALDASGGNSPAGSFSGLQTWSGQLRVARDGSYAYAAGYDSGDAPKVWSLNLNTGVSSSVSASQNTTLGGVTPNGQLIVATWNGSSENVSLMNPSTGATQSVGVLGDLFGWQSQMAYDEKANIVYAIGEDSSFSGHYRLYRLDLLTGTHGQVSVGQSYILGGIRSDGTVIGSYWNGGSQRVVAINPSTGNATDLGSLGLSGWHNDLVWDPVGETAYALGSEGMTASYRLYWLEVGTGNSGSVAVDGDYFIGRY